MSRRFTTYLLALAACSGIATLRPALLAGEATLYLRCKPDNDLYKVLLDNSVSCSRFDTPDQAVRELKTSRWEVARECTAAKLFGKYRKTMLPDDTFQPAKKKSSP